MGIAGKEKVDLNRDCEVIAVPSGIRQILPKGTAVRIEQARGGSFTVSNDIHAIFRIDGQDADALGRKAPAGAWATPEGPLTEKMVWDALRTVYDPELPVNVVDLGLVYSCAIATGDTGAKTIAVRMAMTSPGCGMSNVLKADVQTKLMRLPDVAESKVEVVFDPPWSPARMSEAARLQLGMDMDDSRSSGFVQIS